MIDVGDLPLAVQRAVLELPAEATPVDGAGMLRSRAAHCWQSISGIWPTSQWHQVHEQLSLCGAFLTAASRLEEEGGTR